MGWNCDCRYSKRTDRLASPSPQASLLVATSVATFCVPSYQNSSRVPATTRPQPRFAWITLFLHHTGAVGGHASSPPRKPETSQGAVEASGFGLRASPPTRRSRSRNTVQKETVPNNTTTSLSCRWFKTASGTASLKIETVPDRCNVQGTGSSAAQTIISLLHAPARTRRCHYRALPSRPSTSSDCHHEFRRLRRYSGSCRS